MPIRGCTDAPPRFTRAGHIRLGVKTQNARGSVYPEKSDHFIADFESPESAALFHQIYGPQPKKITIAFAHEHVDEIFPQWYMCYGASAGLKCKGDGQVAWRADDKGDLREVECPGPAECDFGKANRCKQQARMSFFIRGLPGFQVFQCNTTSWNSIRNINSGLEMLRVVRGDRPVRGVWVDLYIVPQTAQHAGKQVQIYVLKLDIPTNLDNLKALECALESPRAALPAPDESRDEYLTPTLPAATVVTCDHPADLRERFQAICEATGVNPADAVAALKDSAGVAKWSEIPAANIESWMEAAAADADDAAPWEEPAEEPVTSQHPVWSRLIAAAQDAGLVYTDVCAQLMQEHDVLDCSGVPVEAVEARIAQINAAASAAGSAA